MQATACLRIALPTPLRRLFDYLPPQHIDLKGLVPGVRVRVPFGKRTLIGVLIAVEKKSSVPYEKLKNAEEILDIEPILPPDVFNICQWAAEYYHYSLGEVLAAAMPALVRKGKPVIARSVLCDEAIQSTALDSHGARLHLNPTQQHAVTTITEAQHAFQTFLLDGVTGSGKTEVYLRVIEAVIARSVLCDEAIQSTALDRHGAAAPRDDRPKQVLVLVPEISLTPQTIARFESRFSVPVVALHSGLTDKQRYEGWLKARSGEASIVIGTRSAIFTPFANLGLIIIDEEHDSSFKQQDRFRYHARDLAIMRARENNIPIVLGSATPSLESLLNANNKRYAYLPLPERAGNAVMPTFQMIDLNQNKVEEGLSEALLSAVKSNLENNNQVMLFLNRRGFAPVLYCTECAWIAECRRCDARMVYHRNPKRLQCHHCDTKMAIPNKCKECKGETLQPVGLGTQRLEETLAKHFPDTPIIRVDRDSTRNKGALHALLDEVHAQPKAILLGTQMLAKGHHFPNVTLVGVIDADSGLFSADFRAAEQMGQLLLQVSGRAGREDKPGTVMIQTRHPDHPLLQTLITEGYHAFATKLLDEREQATLPPYSYFAVFRAEAYKSETVNQFLQMVKDAGEKFSNVVSMLGPVPAILSKKKGLHCENLLIKAKKRSTLQHFLRHMIEEIETNATAKSVKWILDVDPVEVG